MAEQQSTQEGQQHSLLTYHSSPPSRKRKPELQYPHNFDHQQQQQPSSYSQSWTYPPQPVLTSVVDSKPSTARLEHHHHHQQQQREGLGNWDVTTPSFHHHDPSRRSSSPYAGSNNFTRPLEQVPSSTSSSNTETTLRSQVNFEFLPSDDISTERRDTIFKQEDIDLSFGLPTLPHDTTDSGAVYHHEPSSYTDRGTARQLRLTDLDSIHERGQQQLIQSWVGGRSANATPTTPAFFSPGFLDSLQQDEQPPPSSHEGLADHSTPYALQHVDWQQRQHQHHHQQQQQHQGVSTAFQEFSPFATVDTMAPPNARTTRTDSNDDPMRYYQCPGYSLSPPQSPAPSPSTASGAGTPVYGRLSNLSLRGNIPRHQSPNTHLPPTIPEGDEELTPKTTVDNEESIDRRTLKAGLVTARIMQSAATTAKLRPFIQSYLQMPDPMAAGEKTVMVLTSKVAQKSYGTEKRFLCPPPTAILIGTSWWTRNRQIYNDPILGEQEKTEYQPPRLTIYISGEALSQSGQVEWYASSGTVAGITGHSKQVKQEQQQQQQQQSNQPTNRFRNPTEESSSTGSGSVPDWTHNHEQDPLAAGRCVAKNLHINDADEKRKRVECLVRIQLGQGALLGTVASRGIKVISKPSKKRQSVKNMELCIHHGTTISLFNRIRSQTVSTKYLCVSNGSAFAVPGFQLPPANGQSDGTCFVARTSGWDPFVIWIVDTARAPSETQESDRPEDYVGNPLFLNRGINYPPPPAIALKNATDQPVPIHYNQHIVLQCLTTGLVSPVMIIRKVDKASTVVGGARWQMDDPQVTGGGGEFGDEVLGDPVSQLHKVALQIVQDPAQTFQQQQQWQQYQHQPLQQQQHSMEPQQPAMWMMPRSTQPVTYLACLNDMVGMHKTSEARKPIQTWDGSDVTSQEGGKVVRKRRVSSDQPPSKLVSSMSLTDLTTHHHHHQHQQQEPSSLFHRARSNSMDHRRNSLSRRMSVSSTGSSSCSSSSGTGMGAFWSEDVSDAAVWTIVGTDCATYKFMAQQPPSNPGLFPFLTHYTANSNSEDGTTLLTLHGENFSRDLQVWLGDVRASQTEYRSRELFLCRVPNRMELLESCFAEKHPDGSLSVPILLLKEDGPIVYKTNHYYRFS